MQVQHPVDFKCPVLLPRSPDYVEEHRRRYDHDIMPLVRDQVPAHISNIPELDFSADLFGSPLDGPWLRLGAQTKMPRDDAQRARETISRQTLLLSRGGFGEVFDRLGSIGNVLRGLGKPGGEVRNHRGTEEYAYIPFHQFQFSLASAAAEPLVFLHEDTQRAYFFINPDLWMGLGLEERAAGSGVWWDPRRGADVLVNRVLDDGLLQTVEIRTDYLLKYLRARQMCLLVGHYRDRQFIDPTPEAVAGFVQADEDMVLGSPEQGVKAIVQNWGLRKGTFGTPPFLYRRLHLWVEIKSPELDLSDPWDERPDFDAYCFTLPTSVGPVAPARWRSLKGGAGRAFDGVTCDFLDRVHFRQEVLVKYQGATGFEVKDDGSVVCMHYWSLGRSTHRLGNELLATAIGDFAEGVPFEEWQHWKQYVVDPPSAETTKAIVQEVEISAAVNSLVDSMKYLNNVCKSLAITVNSASTDPVWTGSLDSLTARQLKWVYPASADNDEFLKRATLASTLFLDGLQTPPLRALAEAFGPGLHRTFDTNSTTLGSRNLLQRLTLIAQIVSNLAPNLSEIPDLVRQSEGRATNPSVDLQSELEAISKGVRRDFAPLAFLYDLRTGGGLAHPPRKESAADAAANLGLPRENWHRTDYLKLLRRISESLHATIRTLQAAARMPLFGSSS